MKKQNSDKEKIIFIIALATLLQNILPEPVNTVVSLIILVPVLIYLFIDIFKHRNT